MNRKHLSTFQDDDRIKTAEIWLYDESFYIKLYEDFDGENVLIDTIAASGKSIAWAETIAEDWINDSLVI